MIGIWNLVLGLSSAARVVAEAALELGIWCLKIYLGFGAWDLGSRAQLVGFGVSTLPSSQSRRCSRFAMRSVEIGLLARTTPPTYLFSEVFDLKPTSAKGA